MQRRIVNASRNSYRRAHLAVPSLLFVGRSMTVAVEIARILLPPDGLVVFPAAHSRRILPRSIGCLPHGSLPSLQHQR